MNKKTALIFGIAFLLIVAFIWGNSVLSSEVSGKISNCVGTLISRIVGTGDGSTTVGGISVRKMGHFCEFFALGVVSWLLLRSLRLNKSLTVAFTIVFGLSIPLLDETIQIFSGRGHSIRDVWIDVGGFATGTAVTLFVIWCVFTVVKCGKNKHK